MVPQRILRAPASLVSATQPQPNGSIWMLAGTSSMGLFQMDSSTGHLTGSVSVSGAARSVAETSTGVIGLALGTCRTGALELLSSTGKVTKTIPLPRPPATSSSARRHHVLRAERTANTASVTIVNSRGRRVQGTVPMPSDTVSVAPDVRGTSLYALQPDGQVSQIAIAGGKVVAEFAHRDDTARPSRSAPTARPSTC